MIQSTKSKTLKKKNFIKEGHLRLRLLLRTQGGVSALSCLWLNSLPGLNCSRGFVFQRYWAKSLSCFPFRG